MSKGAGLLAVALGLAAGCAHAPINESARFTLDHNAQSTVHEMTTADPALRPLMDQASAYVVFPEVKQAGLVVGGAGGTGVVYQNGRPIAYAELKQGSVGAVVGAQRFSEMIVIRDAATLDHMRAGDFHMGAQASAVIVKQGAAAATRFGENGLAVFVKPQRGAMVNASLMGQSIRIKE
jgi:lipid-binding SYLF domain-containing protein